MSSGPPRAMIKEGFTTVSTIFFEAGFDEHLQQ